MIDDDAATGDRDRQCRRARHDSGQQAPRPRVAVVDDGEGVVGDGEIDR